MITNRAVIDQITVMEYGQIQVRTATVVLRDGAEIARTYHRHVVSPGQDLSREAPRVKTIGAVVHTPEVIESYRKTLATLTESNV